MEIAQQGSPSHQKQLQSEENWCRYSHIPKIGGGPLVIIFSKALIFVEALSTSTGLDSGTMAGSLILADMLDEPLVRSPFTRQALLEGVQ
jgi:hypothetical protein